MTRAAAGVDLRAGLAATLARLLPDPPPHLGIAVSGGSDSLALMVLLAQWAGPRGITLHVATVNHHLRPEAGAEADRVAQAADALGLAHDTLDWHGWDGRGNLQDTARRGRRAALSDWAQGKAITHIALGHTRDDQAETLLMRLARGSGVDGLAGMAPVACIDGLTWLRPLLDIGREDLRGLLRAEGMAWADDPGNDDTAYDRIKARRAMAHLAPLGLSAARLAETASAMAEARAALRQMTHALAETCLDEAAGAVTLEAGALDAALPDIRERLVAHILMQLGQTPYRPRRASLRRALAAPRRATLHGCVISRARGQLRITREARALVGVTAPLGQVWDGRWRITPPADWTPPPGPPCHIRALASDGLAQCPDRAQWHAPRDCVLTSPSVWQGARLIAAPMAGLSTKWDISSRQSRKDLLESLLSD